MTALQRLKQLNATMANRRIQHRQSRLNLILMTDIILTLVLVGILKWILKLLILVQLQMSLLTGLYMLHIVRQSRLTQLHGRTAILLLKQILMFRGVLFRHSTAQRRKMHTETIRLVGNRQLQRLRAIQFTQHRSNRLTQLHSSEIRQMVAVLFIRSQVCLKVIHLFTVVLHLQLLKAARQTLNSSVGVLLLHRFMQILHTQHSSEINVRLSFNI